jgi:hypothetical protein
VTGTVTYTRFAVSGCTGTGTTVATVTIGAANAVPSASDTPPSAGSFSYQASYGGDTNNNAFTGTCANVTVNKTNITSLTTAATSPITVGASTTVSATLVGGFPSTGVTGSVTYTRFVGTVCTGTGTTVATVTIGAANAVPSASDTPPSAGSFAYQASYSGDINNNAFSGTCAVLTVNKTNITSLTTAATSPITVGASTTVSATLVGGFPSSGVTGTVTYTRFAVSGCTGTGTSVATVTIGAANAVPTASNTPPSAGSFSYQASYSGDTNNNAFTGTCANVTVNKTNITSLTTAATSPITVGTATTLSATLVGGFPSTGVTGTVTYTRFTGSGCTGTGTTVATVTIGASNAVPTATDSPSPAGSYSYSTSYSGDVNNNVFTGTCANVTVNKTNITSLTTAVTTPITVGGSATVSATLVGGFPSTGVTGTVTYTRFTGSGCTGTGTTVATVTIGAANAVPSATDSPTPAGSYSYSTSYSGDANNNVFAGSCANLTVNKANITSLTTGATATITVGSSVSLTATLVGGFPSTGVTGTVTYARFTGSGCTGTGSTVATVTIGAANAVPGASDTPTPAGSYSYATSYSGDANNNVFTGTCANVTVNKTNITSLTTAATSPITVGASTTVSATLVGGFPSTGVTGTVTYTRFVGSGCTGTGTSVATVTIGGSNAVPTASNAPPSAGSFSYEASYSGDANNNVFTGTCANVTVNKTNITSLTTAATSPINVGTSTTLSATLVGGFPSTGVTGTVTYTRFTGSGCTGTGVTVATVTIGAANAVPSASDSPSPAGSYSYSTSYSGDANNNVFAGTCANVTVNKVNITSLTTAATSPINVGTSTTLSATLVGGFPSTGVTGTVTYARFTGSGCTGTGTTIATVTIGAANAVPTASDTPTPAGTYSYSTSYSGDANNNVFTGTCANVTVNKINITSLTTAATSPITIGSSTTLSATLVGGFPSTGVSGTVIYTRFAGTGCTGTGTTIATVTIGAGNSVPTATDTPATVASFSYQASYSGDANNNVFTGTCANVTVNKAQPSISTAVTPPSITTGQTATVSATLTGGFPSTGVSGSVTYTSFAAATCTGTGTVIATVTVGAGNSVPTTTVSPTTTTSYQASYGGDANNNIAASTNCATLTVSSKIVPTLATVIQAATSITVGASVQDTATITETGSTAAITGTVTYTLFSFTALPSASTPCSGGTAVGTAQTVTIGTGNAVPNAAAVTPTPAGFYGYSASYSGDTNYAATTSNCEPLTVNKASITSLTTAATSPITVGSSTAISATLVGGFPSTGVTGTVTYTRFAVSGCTGTGTTVATVTVGASNAVPSASDTPTPAGSYSYQASYSGDANNNPFTGTCANVTVNKTNITSLTTAATSPITVGSSTTISATLVGGFPTTGVTGTVTYTRFTGSGCTGTGTTIATVTIGTANAVPTASNTPTPAGSYSYQASYSGDVNNNAFTGTCANVTVNKTNITSLTTAATSPITVGGATTLSATLVGGFPSTGVTGTVTYSRFTGSGCSGTGTTVATVTIGASNAVPAATDTPIAAGSYSYSTSYSGDVNNNAFTGTCANVTVIKANITSLTTAVTSPITVGSSATVSATLVGGFPATGVTGTVTYTKFTGTGCTGTGTILTTVTVGASNAVPSASDTPASAGSFSYSTSYSGDVNNNAFTGTCANLTVNKTNITSLTTAVSPTTITSGQSVTISATLVGGFPSTGVTGTVTYTKFTGTACTGTGTTVTTVTIGAGNSVPSATDSPTATTSYQASYGGDTNNNAFTGTCSTVTVSGAVSLTISVTSPITVGSSTTISATLTGGIPTTGVTGTVTYTRYSGSGCSGTGTTVATVTIGASNSVPSATDTPAPAGSYSYLAMYSGDVNNPATTSNCALLTVNKTNITALSVAVTSPITIGSTATLSAVLTGGFPSTGVTGTVAYTRFSGSGCTGTGTIVATVTIGASNAVPTATDTPSTAGSYSYNAFYGGDVNNNAFTSGCANLTVNKANITSLTTAATSPITVGGSTTLSATLVGGFPSTGVTGTVTYFRYVGAGCTGTAITVTTVTVGAGNSVPSASDIPPSAGSFSYLTTYNGDNNNNPFTGTCANVTVNKTNITSLTTAATSPITVGSSTTLSATLTGGFPSTGVTGSVTYARFSGSGCTGTGTPVATVTIGAGNSVPSASDTPTPAGSYSYTTTYSGDTNNNPFTGTCANVTVNKTNISSLMTTVNPSSITAGQSTTISAALTGGFPTTGVTGTVTYTRFAGVGCTGTGTTVATVTIGAGNSIPTATDSPTATSSYQASYSGDANNNAFTGTCASLTVTTVAPDFSLTASASSIAIPAGGSGSDVLTVASLSTFTGSVALTNSAVPSGVTVIFVPNPVVITTVGTSIPSVMTIFAGAPAGTIFTITITGTSGTILHSVNVTVTITPSVAFTAGKLHWTHHLSLSKSASTQSWTAIVSNSLSTSANVVVRIRGQSTSVPANTFDVTCGVVCVDTNGNVNNAALAAGAVSVPVSSSFSFSFSQTISSIFLDQKISFTATVYWTTNSVYGATSTKSGSFAVVS